MRQLKTRVMYIENKSGSLNGLARIGRVTFTKTGKSVEIDDDVAEEYWRDIRGVERTPV